MSTRWKLALATACGAAVAAVAVIALSGRASDDAGATVPPDTSAPGTPTDDPVERDGRTITVNGHGTVSVVPDTADLSAGVQANADTATAALDTIGTESQALIDTLKGAGIAEDDIQTSGLSLWPTFGNDGRRITGYQASTSVTATIRDVTQVGAVVDALKGFVGEELTLSGVSFSYADPEAVMAEARNAAFANAQARAEQYAAAADVELGDIVEVIEANVATPVSFRAEAAAADQLSVAVAPGSQDLAADVTVVFAME